MTGRIIWSNVTPNITVNPKDTVANPFGMLGAAGAEMLASYKKAQQEAEDKLSAQHLADSLGQLAGANPSNLDGNVLRSLMGNSNMTAQDRMKLIGAFNTLKQQDITNTQNQNRLDILSNGQQFENDLSNKRFGLDVLNAIGTATDTQNQAVIDTETALQDAKDKQVKQQQETLNLARQFQASLGLDADLSNENIPNAQINNGLKAMSTNTAFSKLYADDDWNSMYAGKPDEGGQAVSLHTQFANALLPGIKQATGNQLNDNEARLVANQLLPKVLSNIAVKPGSEFESEEDVVKYLSQNAPGLLNQSGLDFSNPDTAKQLAAFQAAIPDHSKQADDNYNNFIAAEAAHQNKEKERLKQQEADKKAAEELSRRVQQENLQRISDAYHKQREKYEMLPNYPLSGRAY